MISPKNREKIREIIKEFFKKTTFDVEIEFFPQKEKTLPVKIKTTEPQILIGEKGHTLIEIQHLLKAILRKQIDGFQGYVDLDINNYKKKKIEYLKELASSVADEVALSKKEKILPPMSAYERRIIHLELAERRNVTTESIGREPERKVVVRPYP
jgi:spoIIIJ-associated protein